MKNRNINYLSLFLLLLLFASCKKVTQEWKATKVNGVVRNSLSNLPIEGVKVEIISTHEDRNGMITSKIIETLHTDIEGNFSYKFHADKDNSYYALLSKAVGCYTPIPEEIKKGKKNAIESKLVSSAYLQFHLKNVAPFDNNDNICVYFENYGYTAPTICKSGANVDYISNDIGNFYGDNKILISWIVIKNGISTLDSDSIFIEPCIINNYTINY